MVSNMTTSYGTSREQFNIASAIGAIKGEALKVDFKALSAMATICGYEGMETAKEARATFICDLVSVLGRSVVPELKPVCLSLHYNISVSVPCGWRSARAHSKCIVLGGKVYVYECRVDDPPGSKRQRYNPEWWAAREISKAKIMSLFEK